MRNKIMSMHVSPCDYAFTRSYMHASFHAGMDACRHKEMHAHAQTPPHMLNVVSVFFAHQKS